MFPGFGRDPAVEITKRGHEVIAIVEAAEPAFRFPVGDDAQMVMAARAAMDDAVFEAAMRETLQLDW
jgi:hypothetical protein